MQYSPLDYKFWECNYSTFLVHIVPIQYMEGTSVNNYKVRQ